MSDLTAISIVTPSYNQGSFIEQNILSIQKQHYAAVEHIAVDGGSTDNTLQILDSYKDHFATIISEKDDGQYYAINKGFNLATGEIMTWLNSDDVYLPSTLHVVGEIFRKFPEIEWLTTKFPLAVSEDGTLIKVTPVYGFTRSGFRRGENLPGMGWPATCYIQQESTFWRRSLWQKIGGYLDTRYKVAGDFDLWARFFEHADLYSIDIPLGCFRRHNNQRTSTSLASYLTEAKSILARIGENPRGGFLESTRLWLRRSTPPQINNWAIRRKLIAPAPSVTYDWESKEWSLQQR